MAVPVGVAAATAVGTATATIDVAADAVEWVLRRWLQPLIINWKFFMIPRHFLPSNDTWWSEQPGPNVHACPVRICCWCFVFVFICGRAGAQREVRMCVYFVSCLRIYVPSCRYRTLPHSLSLLCSDELDCVVRGDSHGHFFDSRKWGRRRRQLFFFSLLLPRDKSYRLDSF